MTAATKPRYRAPSQYREVEVSLDDFDDDQITDYLRHRGYFVGGTGAGSEDEAGGPVPGEGPLLIDEEDLHRIATLSLCGQKESARDFLIEMVERRIGRSLRGPK